MHRHYIELNYKTVQLALSEKSSYEDGVSDNQDWASQYEGLRRTES